MYRDPSYFGARAVDEEGVVGDRIELTPALLRDLSGANRDPAQQGWSHRHIFFAGARDPQLRVRPSDRAS